jgi:hypothetical protein
MHRVMQRDHAAASKHMRSRGAPSRLTGGS